MSEAVPRTVTDANRAAIVQASIGRLESELVGFRTTLENFELDLRMMNARRDVQRSQLAERLDQFDLERKAARTRVLDIHLQMTAATTAEEWKHLSKYERAALVASGR
ncbi:hypothetical protein DSM104443_01656 [Usitatibacter rugosus]|uniref:Uncharacterized protein n=2 Tax=Usitatibacter rugosus TaxID=2732067 RepID=A0A6M4GU89_9PROT|nr:hypothetical protein DSM104443_01656 [Usitatibacter rugosus]